MPLIGEYKKHGKEMYKGFLYPIGQEPDNASRSGFQILQNNVE